MVKSRVWTPSIVELEVSPERGPGPTDRFIAYEIHLLVLESSPPAFDEGIVPPASFAVHGGADTIDFEQVGKRAAQVQALVDACNDNSGEELKKLRRAFAGFVHKAYNTYCPKDSARQIDAWAANRPDLSRYLN